MRTLTALLLATLLAAALAGCLDGSNGNPIEPASTAFLHVDELPLSEVRFGTLPAEEMWVPSSIDGQTMHVVLWRPDTSAGPAADPAWKAPVVLIDTPYRVSTSREELTNAAEAMGSEAYDWLITELVPRGYAVAYKEVRGTGESGGCLEQTARTQWQDGYDTIERLAAQPWSNGKVGMFGKSYLAEAQYGAAILQPPHLTTIVPVASVSGQYEWNFYDGVPLALHNQVGTAGYITGSSVPPGTTPEGLVNYVFHYECQAEMLAAAADTSGDWNQYWQDRELRDHMQEIRASVLYVHGLQDWNVRQVAIRDSFEKIPSEKRLILGQWHHDHPDGNTFNAAWSREDWRTIVHAWYDHELLGADNGILDRLPAVQVQDSQGNWRAEEQFPPAATTPVTFHLGNQLLASAPVAPPDLALRENDEAFLREQAGPAGIVPDAPDTPPAELVFTSAPLQADLHFSGWPVLAFNLTLTDGLYPDPDTTITATLAADLFITGCEDAAWVNEGFASARHRNGVRAPADVPEGERLAYTLRFSPADTVVLAGCSLELQLASSNPSSQPAFTFWAGVLHDGTLTFPTVDPDFTQVGLDVPMGGVPE